MKVFRKFQEYAIYFFLFSLCFETMNFLNLGIDYLVVKISLSILFIATCLNLKSLLLIKYFSKYLVPILIYFFILTLASYLNRSGQYQVFFEFLFFINILIFIILITFSKVMPGVLLKGLLAFGFGNLILTLLYFLNVGLSYIDRRVTIFGMNQNFLGVNLIITFFTFSSLIFENTLQFSKKRYWLLLSFPLLLIFLIETGSRVALLSLILGSFLYVFYNKSLTPVKRGIFFFFTFFISIVFWQFYLKNSFVVERLYSTINDGDMANRDIIWTIFIAILGENYFFGIGKTGYASIAGELSPHNVLLEVLLYTGLVGLLIFLFFYVRVFRAALRKMKTYSELLSIVLIIPISGIILSGQIFEHKIFWVLFAYICGSSPVKNIIYRKTSN